MTTVIMFCGTCEEFTAQEVYWGDVPMDTLCQVCGLGGNDVTRADVQANQDRFFGFDDATAVEMMNDSMAEEMAA